MTGILTAAETLLAFATVACVALELFLMPPLSGRLRPVSGTLGAVYCSFAIACVAVTGVHVPLRHPLCVALALIAHLLSDGDCQAVLRAMASRLGGRLGKRLHGLTERLHALRRAKPKGETGGHDAVRPASLDDFRSRPPEPPANPFVARSARVSDENTILIPVVDAGERREEKE